VPIRPPLFRLVAALGLAIVVGAQVTAAGSDAQSGSGPIMEPLWELGLFNFVADLPHYPGSDESRVYAFPTPFLTYRGKYLRAGREGVRGIFYQGPRIETSISLSGNPPVDEDNEARAGMPGLDAIGELGPSIKWYFLGRDPVDRVYLQAAARAAAAIDFASGLQVRYQGVAGGLKAVYYNRSSLRDQRIKFQFGLGLSAADRVYNGYFYDVAPAYATATRPAYHAAGGYSGASLSFSIQYDMTPRVSFGFYSRWDNLSGTAFADSPLVKQENNFVVGAVLILRPLRSATLVSSEAFD